MRNYVGIVFGTFAQAELGLEHLWKLNRDGAIDVHAAAIVRRDPAGDFVVSNKRTFSGFRTIAGATAGLLIGMLTGPAGVAAGLYAGGVAGMLGDVIRSGEEHEAVDELEAGLGTNQAAIVAEVSEHDDKLLDSTMRALGAHVYRRRKDEMRRNFFTLDDPEPQETGYFADPSA